MNGTNIIGDSPANNEISTMSTHSSISRSHFSNLTSTRYNPIKIFLARSKSNANHSALRLPMLEGPESISEYLNLIKQIAAAGSLVDDGRVLNDLGPDFEQSAISIRDHEEEEQWEERCLGCLQEDFNHRDSLGKNKNRNHPLRKMKRPMVIPQIILELQDEKSREYALRCLSNFLVEKRQDDTENYLRTGLLLYYSCCTIAILLQEVLSFFSMMMLQTVTVRASKRLANVLTLYQCVAANKETRHEFVKSSVPNFLVPLVQYDAPMEVYDNIRAIALSVFGILCQAREPMIIQWAVESNLVVISWKIIETGNDLSKVIGMHILEAIMQDDYGMSYICSPANDHLLKGLLKTWEHLVTILSVKQDYTPRLLFHIIRCYYILCGHARGRNMVMKRIPDPIVNGSFRHITEDFPVIGSLLKLLLLTIGKTDSVLEVSLPHESLLYQEGIV